MFTTISTYCAFPKTIEQIRQNMTGHVTSRYQGLYSSEEGAKVENLGTRLYQAETCVISRSRGLCYLQHELHLWIYYMSKFLNTSEFIIMINSRHILNLS
jgi:hypothetical protein